MLIRSLLIHHKGTQVRRKIFLNALGLVLLLLSATCLSAEELKIGVNFSIPPYVLTESNSGLELEILQEALRVKGHTISIEYLPLARTFLEFEQGEVDCIMNVQQGALSIGFYSDVAITFQNVAISLAKQHLSIQQISDLLEKDVVAFQKASTLLDAEFGRLMEGNAQYREVADQIVQLVLLFKERTDVIVMDLNIFNYFRKQAQTLQRLTDAELNEPVTVHQIFPPTAYRFAFRTERQRDDFNAGLAAIQANGVYAQLFKKYESLLILP